MESLRKEYCDKFEGDKKKVEIEIKKTLYDPNAKEYAFDLNVINRNSRGEIIEQPPKTQQQIDEF